MMKKIEILQKDQKNSLFLFLDKIQTTFYFLKFLNKFKYNQYLKKKIQKKINHNKFFFLPFFFDVVIFLKNSNKEQSIFVRFLKKKIKKKNLFFKTIFKIEKFKKKNFFNLYLKFISFTFKTGKKFFWEKIFSKIFNTLSLNYKYSRSFLLAKIFIRLFTRVELKKVKSRKRVTYIPFFITIKRSLFLALKWIFLSILKNNNNISTSNKLYLEISQIIFLRNSESIKKLFDNNTNSFNNRSNMYYRWDFVKI